MDDGGQYGYYTYDTKNATLQRFSGAVFTDSGETAFFVPHPANDKRRSAAASTAISFFMLSLTY